MQFPNNPPVTQTIVRNEAENDAIDIVALDAKYFDRARDIENDFFGSNGKGCCFGLCPFSWCPVSREDFESIYRKDPDRCSTYGVAIRQSDQLVVGVITLRLRGQAATFEEKLLHSVQDDELYVDHIAVTKDARGMGVGTKLMKWAEEKAKERNATKLTLGVVKGNPAKRLYDRLGYVDVSSSTCIPACILGRPHGQFGVIMMEKHVY